MSSNRTCKDCSNYSEISYPENICTLTRGWTNGGCVACDDYDPLPTVIKFKKKEEDTVTLPKDSNGDTIHIGDEITVLNGSQNKRVVTAIGKDEVFYTIGNSPLLCCSEHREVTLVPPLVEPYDKDGNTIEVGMWVERDIVFKSGFKPPSLKEKIPASKVIDIKPDKDLPPGLHIKLEGREKPKWFWWEKDRAHSYKIVPEPDSLEKIKNDKKYKTACLFHSTVLFSCEDCESPAKQAHVTQQRQTELCDRRYELDLIDRAYKVGLAEGGK